MQADGLLCGATQALKVPTLKFAPGAPNTHREYFPTAPLILKVAEVAGAANVAWPETTSPCVTTIVAELSAEGT